MARWANLTKTSAGGEGTKAAAPDRFEDDGRARGLFRIRFAQVRRLRRPPDGRRALRRAERKLRFRSDLGYAASWGTCAGGARALSLGAPWASLPPRGHGR